MLIKQANEQKKWGNKMASIDDIEILKTKAIRLRVERNLYGGLDRGERAEAELQDVEAILLIRTGREY